MAKHLRQAALFVWLFSAVIKGGFAQSETAAVPLTLPVGARANAMGGALTAVAGDPFAAYYNPASIGAGSYGTFAFFRAEWWKGSPNSLPMTYASAAYTRGSAAFALTYHRFSHGAQRITRRSGEVIEKSSYDQAIVGSVAIRVSPTVSVGGAVKRVKSEFVMNRGSAWGLDLGLLVTNLLPQATLSYREPLLQALEKFDRPDPPGLSIGIALTNSGPDKMEYRTGGPGDPLPQTLRIGLAYRPVLTDAVEVLLVSDIEKLLVRRHPDGSTDSFVKAMVTAWNDGLDSFRFGAEINLFHLVAVRFGRDLKYRWTRKGESIDEWTLGFGFGPEWARVNVVRRGFPSFSRPRWVWMDVSVAY